MIAVSIYKVYRFVRPSGTYAHRHLSIARDPIIDRGDMPVAYTKTHTTHPFISAIQSTQLLSILRNSYSSFLYLLITADGEMLFANRSTQSHHSNMEINHAVGSMLHEIAPKEWADERIALLRRVVEEQRSLIVLELISGYRLCSQIHPLQVQCDGEDVTILNVIVEPVLPANFHMLIDRAEELNVVVAECIDLGPLNALSDRELEILALMGQGYRPKDIAEKLCRSISTINRHRESIGEKLDINDRAELIRLTDLAVLQPSDIHRTRTPFKAEHLVHEMLDFTTSLKFPSSP